jgi:hypothetical protein
MAYDLEIKKEESYLHVRAAGSRTRATISAIGQDILEACRKHDIYEVLVDIRDLTGEMGIFDSMLIVTKEFPKLNAENVVKKAAIINPRNRHERSRFFEQIAVKRGYNLRLFEELTPAIEWLTARQPVTCDE